MVEFLADFAIHCLSKDLNLCMKSNKQLISEDCGDSLNLINLGNSCNQTSRKSMDIELSVPTNGPINDVEQAKATLKESASFCQKEGG